MLRHFLELIDSASILIKNSSIDPCKILLRAALETFLSLEYMLTKDFEIRSMSFLTCHFNKNINLYKKLKSDTDANKEIKTKFSKDKLVPDFNFPKINNIDFAITNLEGLLKQPIYNKFQEEYLNTRKAIRRTPNWYSLFSGPKDLEGLATFLGYIALYEVFYRAWSGPTHGTDIIQGKFVPNDRGSVDVFQIRYFKEAQPVTGQAISLTILALSSYIEYRLPEKDIDYQKWYMTIRDASMKINGRIQFIKVI
jgi:hypothetical protein